jgi:predicted Zn-dependent protease
LAKALPQACSALRRFHKDERLQRYVNRVGRWVALHSDRPDLPWSFGVIDVDTINAFAMPGGMVVVSNGLLKRLQANRSSPASSPMRSRMWR